MADTTPRLPTTVEAAPYAPYSVLAVLSLGVAVLFMVLLLTFGISAWLSGAPLENRELLIIPVLALVLSFAGRRQIANSEQTRVGLTLCNWAWWIALVGGLGYAAYLLGAGMAVTKDAEAAFLRWSEFTKNANPVDPKDTNVSQAFHGTLSADKQPTFLPTDSAKMQAILGQQMLAFRQCDLIRYAYRSGGDVRFEVIGLEDRKTEVSGALSCRVTVRMTSPEGEYTLGVNMQRVTPKGKAEPAWQILPPQSQQTEALMYVRSAKFNAYGERIRDMELAAQQLVYTYFLSAANLGFSQTRIFDEFSVNGQSPQAAMDNLKNASQARVALLSGLGASGVESPEIFAAIAAKYFKPLDAAQEEKQRADFARAWRVCGLGLPGSILPKNPDISPVLVPGTKGWEIRVPIEMQLSAADRTQATVRVAVVCVVDNPAFLKELADLKANPGPMTDAQHRFLPNKPVPWRIARLESDMKVVAPPRQDRPAVE